jgi:UDPglucose 6-dehydrogenase
MPFVIRSDFEADPFTKEIDKALIDADAVILLTKHKEYQSISLNELATKLSTPILIDGRNMFSKDVAAKAGLTYLGVGKGEHSKRRN